MLCFIVISVLILYCAEFPENAKCNKCFYEKLNSYKYLRSDWWIVLKVSISSLILNNL